MRRTSVTLIKYLGVVALLATVGCGPVTSTVSIRGAEQAVAEAKESTAPYEAVYEYVLAEEYIRKAQEEWSYSDWQQAQRFADLAERYAKEALERAGGGPGLVPGIIDDSQPYAPTDEDAE